MAISHIQHKGREIVFIDYTQCQSQEEMLAVLHQVGDYFRRMPADKQLYSLTDSTGTFSGSEFMNEAKRLNKEVFNHRQTRSAIIGVTGIKKILLNAFNVVAKNKLMAFDNKEQALAYLAK